MPSDPIQNVASPPIRGLFNEKQEVTAKCQHLSKQNSKPPTNSICST